VLDHETGVTNVIDPLGGSYYIESLTHALASEAWKLIEEVEEMGGMTKAVASGMPKLRIEEAAARKQARIDRGEEVIVGVNKYRPPKEDPIEILDIDNAKVRESQIARLKQIRAIRDEARCRAALAALTEGARGNANLLALAIEAARARASVGEISDAMEEAFGRRRAEIKSISGVYGKAYEGDEGFMNITREIEAFAEAEGRRAREAIENDVHVIGISSLAAGHKTLVPALAEALKKEGADDILIVCGGVIPQQDYEFLKKAGASAIFGPGTNIPECAAEVLALIRQKRQQAA